MEKKGETERERVRNTGTYRGMREINRRKRREDRGEEEGKPKGKEARRGCGRRRDDWGSGQGETKERKRGQKEGNNRARRLAHDAYVHGRASARTASSLCYTLN